MPFEKDHPKYGGRKKGTPNKASLLGRELAQELIHNKAYIKELRWRLTNGDAPPALHNLAWSYAFGRPLDPNRRDRDKLRRRKRDKKRRKNRDKVRVEHRPDVNRDPDDDGADASAKEER